MGGPSDPVKNCVLEICCGAAKAQKTLAKAMVAADVCNEHYAQLCAEWLYTHFDLAPAGTLTAFKAEIARLAKLPSVD